MNQSSESETIEVFTLPAYWGSALINDDWSGLDAQETASLTHWLRRRGYAASDCLTVEDETYFAWSNDATSLGGAVAEFSFAVRRN